MGTGKHLNVQTLRDGGESESAAQGSTCLRSLRCSAAGALGVGKMHCYQAPDLEQHLEGSGTLEGLSLPSPDLYGSTLPLRERQSLASQADLSGC